jgi:hypothetical protein
LKENLVERSFREYRMLEWTVAVILVTAVKKISDVAVSSIYETE